MTDMTLCASTRCRVVDRCRRNPACPDAYKASEWRQSWAVWNDENGNTDCPGFIDAGVPDWREG